MNKTKVHEVAQGEQVIEIHPAAMGWPMMEEAALDEMAADIKAHGQQHRIVLWQGQVLDGRNRLEACRRAGVKPKTKTIVLKKDNGPASYVLSVNAIRRHLTPAQNAEVAAAFAPMLAEEAKERQQAGKSADGQAGGRGHKKPQSRSGTKDLDANAGKATRQAAKALGVGHGSVETMVKVRKVAPEVAEKVRTGEIKSVAEAARQAGVGSTRKTRGGTVMAERVELVRALTAEGLTIAEMIIRTGCSRNQISNARRQLGLTRGTRSKIRSLSDEIGAATMKWDKLPGSWEKIRQGASAEDLAEFQQRISEARRVLNALKRCSEKESQSCQEENSLV